MKHTFYLIILLFAAFSSCKKETVIGENFKVSYENVSGGYRLSYKNEGVILHRYCYGIGYNENFIIEKVSNSPQSVKRRKEYDFYIIDREEYEKNWGINPKAGIAGPFDEITFNLQKKIIDPDDKLIFEEEYR